MLDLTTWPPIQSFSFTGTLATDVAGLLHANGKVSTACHCAVVAQAAAKLAARAGLDLEIVEAAALLHDISAILQPRDMMAYAVQSGWDIDQAEMKHPFLLHQRISAVVAKEVFRVTDNTVLSAIACHTTLKRNASAYDMVLFLADKLAWDQEGTPPYGDCVCSALEHSLAAACLVYIQFTLDHGMILHPHQWLLDAKQWLSEADMPGLPPAGL